MRVAKRKESKRKTCRGGERALEWSSRDQRKIERDRERQRQREIKRGSLE